MVTYGLDVLSLRRYNVKTTDDAMIEVWRVACDSPRYPTANRPAIIHVHGGGFVAGGITDKAIDPEDFGPGQLPKGWLQKTGSVCLYVRYRLATLATETEPAATSFPTLACDVYDTLKWANEDHVAYNLGIDRTNISLVGVSAGGKLALEAALKARDEKSTSPLAKLLLVYPMLDPNTDWPGQKDGPNPVLKNETNKQFLRRGWNTYLQEGWKKSPWSKYVLPFEQNFAGMPPMYITFSKGDYFYEECQQFVKILREQNIDIEVNIIDDERVKHSFEHQLLLSDQHEHSLPDEAKLEIEQDLEARLEFLTRDPCKEAALLRQIMKQLRVVGDRLVIG